MANSQMATVMARLSSGMRINSARDDAAGLGIVEQMTAQIRSLDQGTRNSQDMQSLINTAEGALATTNASLIRLREITIQASNDTNTDADRQRLQHEADQLVRGIDSIADFTEFNTMRLLSGDFSQPGLHTASDAQGRGPTVTIGDMSAGQILAGDVNLIEGGQAGRDALLGRIDEALSVVTRQRSHLGAMHNRLDYTIDNTQISSLNLAAGRSRIRDMDMARGMMEFHQLRVLQTAQVMSQRQQQEQERFPLLSLLM
jgi:flagellin